MRRLRNLALQHRWWVLASLMLLSVTSAKLLSVWAAELTAPDGNDVQIAQMVTRFLRQEHLSRRNLDDEISQRALKNFLDSLDPLKFYFTQEDVSEFLQRKNDIDDLVRRGDIRLGYTIYNRYLRRLDERVALVERILATDLDFTESERMATDGDTINYPRTPEEIYQRWKQRVKFDLLVLKADDKLEGKAAVDRVLRRYRSLAKRMHQTDSDELLEMYLTAVTTSYDPHTTYMSPSTYDNFLIQMRLNLEGIGAALQVEDGYTVVNKIIPGGAADKAGQLKPEDRIVSVGQDANGEMVDVVDMKLGDVVKLIRGPAGSIVRLGVLVGGSGEKKIYQIKRAKIELKDSEARSVVFQEGRKADGTPYRVGVIELPSFYMDMEGARRNLRDYKSTTRDVRRILDQFRQQAIDVVVLDLRRNGGGSLTEAIDTTGLFINKGPVVQIKEPNGQVSHYDDTELGVAWPGPLVVLTSKLSASASEILAGAIQDYRRGIVVGDAATHGKGTVQSLLDVGQQVFAIANPPSMGALKITMQQFYRPSGDSTQKRGVLADIALPALTTHMDIGEEDLDFAVEFDRVPPAQYSDYRMVTPEVIKRLRAASDQRIAASEDFQKLQRNIAQYKKQKAEKWVPLNAEEFAARRAELDASQEEEQIFEEKTQGNDEVVKRDFYFNEVIAVSLDYVKQLGG